MPQVRAVIAIRIAACTDTGAAASAAARHIATAARAAVAARGVFTLALSGGRTPGLMLAALAREDLPWSAVHVFQVDERIAPAGDPARNIEGVRETLLVAGALPEANLHPMPVEAPALASAAGDYAERLRSRAGEPPVLDLVHLGLGDDGHTASLVPGDEALQERASDVTVTADYRGHRRMTLTFPALDRARERLWLATGADKAPMLSRLHAGDAGIPAGRVRRDASVVFCDVPATRLLARQAV